ncbi:hypothetical protein JG688_00008473, partial [Phytophthora aleatoria]
WLDQRRRSQVEISLLNAWSARSSTDGSSSTPKAVCKSLRLYTVDERRLDNPALKSWIRYTVEYNKQNPNTKSSMIGTLVEYYSEGLLLQMIIAAKNNPNTEKIVSELQRALLLYQISRRS